MAQVNISTVMEKKEIVVTFTDKPVTAWGGLTLFTEFAQRQGLEEALREAIPFEVTSPNATDLVGIVIAFMSGVLTGCRRFAHLERLRQDEVVRYILGIKRYVSDATFSRFFKRFGQRQVDEMFIELGQWEMNRVALTMTEPGDTATLDLDSSVFERYGHQEG